MAGIKGMCRAATLEERKAKAKARVARWKAAHPEKVKELARRYREQWGSERCKYYALWKKYKLSREDFEAKWQAQQGLCELCKEPLNLGGRGDDAASVDHDHACCDSTYSCGKCLRGIIHKKCNSALGMFDDNLARIKQAAEYLERYVH